jgi:DNA repair photolyase
MPAKEIEAKSVLRKYKRIDSWFVSHYGMNLYRGCTHDCVYCDGRAESYFVQGDFGKDIVVKKNAIEILRKELNPKRRKIPLKRSYILPGGGVGDSYEPIDKKYELTRKALELLYEFNFPVHMLTKSTLINRDIDILQKINKQNKAIISFSFSTVDDKISKIFEPHAALPSERLETISYLKENGFACGMFLMPVIPFITDTPEMIERSIREGVKAGVDFIIFGGMTLKEGRQKEYFMKNILEHFPHLQIEYENLYNNDKWGNPSHEYFETVNFTFQTFAKKYKIPKRIPAYLFNNILDENDLVIVILEQIDYLLKLRDYKSNFGYAAYAISKLDTGLSNIRSELGQINGIGPTIRKIIWEILDTGTSRYYEKLLVE